MIHSRYARGFFLRTSFARSPSSAERNAGVRVRGNVAATQSKKAAIFPRYVFLERVATHFPRVFWTSASMAPCARGSAASADAAAISPAKTTGKFAKKGPLANSRPVRFPVESRLFPGKGREIGVRFCGRDLGPRRPPQAFPVEVQWRTDAWRKSAEPPDQRPAKVQSCRCSRLALEHGVLPCLAMELDRQLDTVLRGSKRLPVLTLVQAHLKTRRLRSRRHLGPMRHDLPRLAPTRRALPATQRSRNSSGSGVHPQATLRTSVS